jgi:transcriptional regulator with XRE-family HTH domain
VDIDDGPFLLTANTPPARVGDRLQQLRTRAGLGRRELAGRLGVGARWVRRWETGTHRLPDPVVRRLLAELGLSLEELLPRREPVRWDAAGSSLVLAGERVVVAPADGNVAVLRAYVELVTTARTMPPTGPWELRNDDLDVLAALLDVDARDLDGDLAAVFALDAESAVALGGRLRRHRVLAATAVATTLLAVAPAADAAPLAPAARPGGQAATVVQLADWLDARPASAPVLEDVPTDLAPVGAVVPFAAARHVAGATVVPTDLVPLTAPAAPVAHSAARHPSARAAAPDVEIADALTIERG